MKTYKWDNKMGVIDETGKQIIQLWQANCSKKFRNMAGKELAKVMTKIEWDNGVRRSFALKGADK